MFCIVKSSGLNSEYRLCLQSSFLEQWRKEGPNESFLKSYRSLVAPSLQVRSTLPTSLQFKWSSLASLEDKWLQGKAHFRRFDNFLFLQQRCEAFADSISRLWSTCSLSSNTHKGFNNVLTQLTSIKVW